MSGTDDSSGTFTEDNNWLENNQWIYGVALLLAGPIVATQGLKYFP